MSSLSRRTLLGAGATAFATASLGFPKSLPASVRRKPKNIIFCVADGMAQQTLSMADIYQSQIIGERSYWHWLANQDFVTNGLQMTRSLSSVVTDSAAASSAWGAGRHIWNGQINEFPDGTKLRTLQSLLREHGMKTGLVTTTTITHATPAGFSITCDDRDKEWVIAERYLEGGFDVLMGGGEKHFAAAKRKDKKDLFSAFAAAGYQVAKSRDEIMNLRARKILGVFSDGHLPYTIDRDNSADITEKVPTLAEMVRVALRNLKGSREGFILQIEGGKVDHAGHANDLGALIFEQIAFEAAVKVAVEFALNDEDTLVVVTSDHATGGPSLNGAGDEYFDSTAGIRTVERMKSSYDGVYTALGKTPSRSEVRDILVSKLNITLSDEEAQGVSDSFAGHSPLSLSTFQGNKGGTLATALSNHTKVGWTSQNHTAEHVMVTALGPGSSHFSGIRENISYHNTLLGFKDIHHSNPSISFPEAQAAREKKQQKSVIGDELMATNEFGIHG